jgi:hypothetical protein
MLRLAEERLRPEKAPRQNTLSEIGRRKQPLASWVSGPGDRIALTVFFIGVALLAAGVVMYFAAVAPA